VTEVQAPYSANKPQDPVYRCARCGADLTEDLLLWFGRSLGHRKPSGFSCGPVVLLSAQDAPQKAQEPTGLLCG
jgi:hypothetical protein